MTTTEQALPTADTVEPLETSAEWNGGDVADPTGYTWQLDDAEVAELEAAVATARGRTDELLEITVEDFPLPTMATKLATIERELIDGRGFTLIRGVPVDRLGRDDAERAYWGIGLHLGTPWPQNARGHLLGDVTDQGKPADDPTSRGNEIGGIAFPYHSDGSDLVGLFCLNAGVEGGTSTVANAVAIHNELVRTDPELAAALYEPMAYDFRGEQAPGKKGWYLQPVFTRQGDRLFVRYIRPYISAARRHEDAPQPSALAEAAMDRVDAMCADPEFHVFMDLEPGDMQFVNNYHVLHARTAYRDDRTTGQIRHLKRLWLETSVLAEADKPEAFRLDRSPDSWAARSGRTMSRLG